MYEKYLKEFTEIFERISRKYSRQTVFCDFIKMCAISMYSSLKKDKQMEQEYLNTINNYSKDYQELFLKMFGKLIMMYQTAEELTDILGPIYEREKFGNSRLGQFFTPHHISDMMAECITDNTETLQRTIETKGYITMNEPTCGAGGMILSLAKVLKKRKINYQNSLLVVACDLDQNCAYMTYIQLALYGIPAVVYCGNSLTNEMRFSMITPLFYLQSWRFERFFLEKNNKREQSNNEQIQKYTETKNIFKEMTVKGNCQISLW